MRKLLLLLLALVPAGILLFAQDKVINDPNAELRSVSDFHAIHISSGIELMLKQGNTEAVAVSASEKEYRDKIKTEVKDGELHISVENNLYTLFRVKNMRLRAYVSFKNLDRLTGSSGSSTTIDGVINAGNLKMRFSSGAFLKGNINASSTTIDQSSGAEINIAGKTQSLSLKASSGATFRGFEFNSDVCDADASSGASIRVGVVKELDADASSGGEIRYKGENVALKKSTSSGGSVKKD